MNADFRAEIRNHLAVIVGQRSGNVGAAIAYLDKIKDSTGGHLQHYLANRSYLKAWETIAGMETELEGVQ